MTGPVRRLGVRYDLRRVPGDVPVARRYARLLAHAAGAEAAGVDVLWVAERPFARNALLPAALPVCAALAMRTRRVRIATGALPLPLHHPLRVAEDAASLDVLSGGRLELGVGLGGGAEGAWGFGIPDRERAGRLEEAVTLLRRSWSGEAVAFEGRHFAVGDVVVHPRPVQRPHPPLWIAARAEAALRRAARLGTGLLTDDAGAARRFLEAAEAAPVALCLPEGVTEGVTAPDAARRALDALGHARHLDILLPGPGAGDDGDASLRGLEELAREVRSSFARVVPAPPGTL